MGRDKASVPLQRLLLRLLLLLLLNLLAMRGLTVQGTDVRMQSSSHLHVPFDVEQDV